MLIDDKLLEKLLQEVIRLEKQFLFDKSLAERKKVQELKKMIEKEVRGNAN